jgi:hypothetical protein
MTAADIAAMPVAEKLRLLEALWDSLCAGTEPTSPWRDAKDRIRAKIQAD